MSETRNSVVCAQLCEAAEQIWTRLVFAAVFQTVWIFCVIKVHRSCGEILRKAWKES